jgi:hypothetical protein
MQASIIAQILYSILLPIRLFILTLFPHKNINYLIFRYLISNLLQILFKKNSFPSHTHLNYLTFGTIITFIFVFWIVYF